MYACHKVLITASALQSVLTTLFQYILSTQVCGARKRYRERKKNKRGGGGERKAERERKSELRKKERVEKERERKWDTPWP